MSEEFAFQQILIEGGAVDLDERPLGPGARIVYGVGDQFLAGAGLTADEDGCIACGDLVNLPVDVAHGIRVANDVLRAEAVFEFVPQTEVFVFQQAVADGGLAPGADVGGDHTGDNAEDALILLQRCGRVVDPVHGNRADDLFAYRDGNTNKADLLAALLFAPEAIQKQRFFRDLGNDHGLAGLHDPAGHALANPVAHLVLAPVRQVMGDLNGNLVTSER